MAVLVDGDNVPVRDARLAFSTVARLGKVTLCRIYGRSPRATRPLWRAAAGEVPGVPAPDFRPAGIGRHMDLDLAARALDSVYVLSWDDTLGAAVLQVQAPGMPIHVVAAAADVAAPAGSVARGIG